VLSNLDVVTPDYRTQFVAAYDALFVYYPLEKDNFRHHSTVMRKVFGRRKRAIPLLHRDGGDYVISTKKSKLRRVKFSRLTKHEPYKTAAEMPFSDEVTRDS
jgi:hypothetical protein